MATPRTVSFYTLGCKLNFSETSAISRQFEEAGYTPVSFDQGGDVVVINTCSVTDFADRKCRKVVRQALRKSPHAFVVVVGCYAQLKPEEIAAIEGVDLVLGAAEKFRILDFLEDLVKAPGKGMVRAGEVVEANVFEHAFSFGDRTRSFLKVQDGCDYKCSFCTIPQARGKSRSDTVEQVVARAQRIAEMGVREIVLTGVNIGDFGNGTEVIEGVRPKKEALFIDLIRELDQVEGIERFRISSIEPNLVYRGDHPVCSQFATLSTSFPYALAVWKQQTAESYAPSLPAGVICRAGPLDSGTVATCLYRRRCDRWISGGDGRRF
jgi:threonylcarbamoyladenosine tRNA methylthiotransferase MtaB